MCTHPSSWICLFYDTSKWKYVDLHQAYWESVRKRQELCKLRKLCDFFLDFKYILGFIGRVLPSFGPLKTNLSLIKRTKLNTHFINYNKKRLKVLVHCWLQKMIWSQSYITTLHLYPIATIHFQLNKLWTYCECIKIPPTRNLYHYNWMELSERISWVPEVFFLHWAGGNTMTWLNQKLHKKTLWHPGYREYWKMRNKINKLCFWNLQL